ncbi:Protein of unknown function [Propionibacterium freudenreichii]|uniref:Uncharacterized protein n=1 Tax=Propionibacterium freudenreichii subsp. freudenreichii TaxID=66712 RepID=A0A0B7NZR8_PROFF|nr:Protein of unknown function [Propionibacterium freudenreichii]CEP26393.1 Protein of unknown function [Propionibacterium freudenreichii subsp. freudenreichii]CEG90894.1 Protein of unknown function [Propionibacterium freudenreichii]CEG95249.1 Protein of unknown function [Propionibacterium freudenreichii]CEG98471.1 Protein of unknown function [Propionibacterium freudenreichii]
MSTSQKMRPSWGQQPGARGGRREKGQD